jgi:hypothetical protein
MRFELTPTNMCSLPQSLYRSVVVPHSGWMKSARCTWLS